MVESRNMFGDYEDERIIHSDLSKEAEGTSPNGWK
jgi:hypothetical protein